MVIIVYRQNSNPSTYDGVTSIEFDLIGSRLRIRRRQNADICIDGDDITMTSKISILNEGRISAKK